MRPLLALALFFLDSFLWVLTGGFFLFAIILPFGHIVLFLLAAATGVLAVLGLILLIRALVL